MDPCSEIVRLAGAEPVVTGGFTAAGPWAIRFPARDKIKFLAVVKGHCWARIDGETTPYRLDAGDVGLLAARRSFVLASDLSVPAVDAVSLFSGVGRTTAQLGDGSEFTHLGGHVVVNPTRGRLLADVLPPWIHIQASSPHAPTLGWLVNQLVEERAAGLPGAQLASTQLTQLLFLQILRAQMKMGRLIPAGWLRALADARIAPALKLMHGQPGRSWHLEELASAAAMSRTSFAFHFKKVAGVAPLAYLTEWRMHLAERALGEETIPVAVVARSLGYTSESAFSNAFKRATGASPRAYRNAARASFAVTGEVSSDDQA